MDLYIYGTMIGRADWPFIYPGEETFREDDDQQHQQQQPTAAAEATTTTTTIEARRLKNSEFPERKPGVEDFGVCQNNRSTHQALDGATLWGTEAEAMAEKRRSVGLPWR